MYCKYQLLYRQERKLNIAMRVTNRQNKSVNKNHKHSCGYDICDMGCTRWVRVEINTYCRYTYSHIN